MVNTVQSRERGSKSIINALLDGDEPQSQRRQLHEPDQLEEAHLLRPQPGRAETDKLRLDLSTINKAYMVQQQTVIAHEQLQSEHNATTTERGLGENLGPTCNDSKHFARMSTKSLPGAKKGHQGLTMAEIEKSKGSMPQGVLGQHLSNQSSICKLKAERNRNWYKQSSQVYQSESKDGADAEQRMMSGGRQTQDEDGTLAAYVEQASQGRASPNAIESNVMKSIEQELFVLQKSRRHLIDPNLPASREHCNKTAASRAKQVLRLFDYDEEAERDQLEFMLTGEEGVAEGGTFQDPRICPVRYTAYSKIKKEGQQRGRSCTPHALSQLKSPQIRPNLYLQHQPESTFQQYPNLLSPKHSVEQHRVDSPAKAPGATRVGVDETDRIARTQAFGGIEKRKVPSQIEIRLHHEPQLGNAEQEVDLVELNERQVVSLTSRDMPGHFLYTGRAESVGASQTDRIDLTKLDRDPVNMHRFEKLVMKLNPFSMNQIQKLSPKNNQVIDKFMDAKKWQRLQQINQKQFDRALKSVIQNWDHRRASSRMHSDALEENSASRINDRETPIQPVLQSKLSDKVDVETQGVDRGRDSQRSRFSRLSERLLDQDKRTKQQRKSHDQRRKSSEQSTSTNMGQSKILFKTHIKVSPVESKNVPERRPSKQSSTRFPIKLQSKNSKDLMKEFSKGMVKIDQILSKQPEIKIEDASNILQTTAPISDLEQSKYKLDKGGMDGLLDQGMLNIQAIEGAGRHEDQGKVPTPTSVDEPLAHRLGRSDRQRTHQSEENHKAAHISQAPPTKSSNSSNRVAILSQTVLARETNPAMLSSSRKAPSGVTGGVAFTSNNEGVLALKKRLTFQRKHNSVFAAAKLDQNLNAEQEQSSAQGNVAAIDEQQSQQDEQQLKLPVPRLVLGQNLGLREKQKTKINEWTRESVESNDVKSPSNTITFGSHPKSKDSQREMQVTGQQIKQESEQLPAQFRSKKVDHNAATLSYDLHSTDHMNVPQLEQHVATIRKIQIREKEKDLQKIKDLLKQFQTQSIDKGSFRMQPQLSQTLGSSTPASNQRRSSNRATALRSTRHGRPAQAILHADPQSTKAEEDERGGPASRLSHGTHCNQAYDKQRELEFLQRKNIARRQGQQLKTSQGTRVGSTGASIEKPMINSDLSSLQDAKAASLRHRSVLPPMSSNHRSTYNHGLLLQPLRQNNQLKSSEQSGVLEGSTTLPMQQTLYQRIINKYDEDCFSNAALDVNDADAQPQNQKAQPSPQLNQGKESGVQEQLSLALKKGAGQAQQEQREELRPEQKVGASSKKDAQSPPTEPVEVGNRSAVAMEMAIYPGRKPKSVLAQELQSPTTQLQDGSPDKSRTQVKELTAEGSTWYDDRRKRPHPLPENVIIQVEESCSAEGLNDSKSLVTAEIAQLDSSSLGNRKGTLHQCSWENQIVSKGTAEGSALSGQEIQRRLLSPDVKITRQSNLQKQRRWDQLAGARHGQEMQNKGLPRERSLMIVKGTAPAMKGSKHTSGTKQGMAIQEESCETARQPARAASTVGPSKSYLARQNKLYQNFRKQRDRRKEQAIHSQKQADREGGLQFNSNIINYQSPRNRTSPLYANAFPAVVDQRYFAALAHQRLHVDVMNKDGGASDATGSALREDTARTEATAAVFSGQGEPAQKAPAPPTQLTKHQQKIADLHKMASQYLKVWNSNENRDPKPGVVQLDLCPEERPRRTIEGPDQVHFAQRLRQASKVAAQQSNRPMTQELAGSFRHYQNRVRLPPKLDDLIRTQRIAMTATSGESSSLNVSVRDCQQRLPTTKNSDHGRRRKQIAAMRGFTPLLGGKVHGDGPHSFIRPPMHDLGQPLDIPDLKGGNLDPRTASKPATTENQGPLGAAHRDGALDNVPSAATALHQHSRSKPSSSCQEATPGLHTAKDSLPAPDSQDRTLYEELFSDQAIARLQEHVADQIE